MEFFAVIAIIIGVFLFRQRELKKGAPEWRFYVVLFLGGIAIYMLINPPP